MTPEARSGTVMQRPIAGEPASGDGPKTGRSLSWLYYVVLPVLFVLVWFLLTDVMTVFPSALLPSPVKVASAFVRAIASGELPAHYGQSPPWIYHANMP